MKKLSSLILLALLPVVASAYDVYVDGIYYDLSEDEATVTCSAYDEYSAAITPSYRGNVVVPASIVFGGKTYSVTAISGGAFADCSELTSVVIPESVTSLGEEAFSSCVKLTTINIPGSVMSIGRNAFMNCSGLTSVTLGDGVAIIDNQAFWNCVNLTSVNLPNSMTSIGGRAFYNCKSLTGISIPGSVKSLGTSVFGNCSGIVSLTIGDGVTSIGNATFAGCTSLTSVLLPESVTKIDEAAFSGCSSLASITFPENVTSIGRLAFNGTAWFNKQPDGMVYAGRVAYKYKGKMPESTELTIREGTVQIAGEAFFECSGLTSITIPEGLTSIGGSAFGRCNNLASVSIPESVTNIGATAFGACSSLSSVTIPKNVTNISSGLFSGCTNLISVIIPEGVKSIGETVFSRCTSLTSLTIPESVTSIGSFALFHCKSLTSLTISNGVTSIGFAALSGCEGLKTVIISKNMKSIDMGVFNACTSLTDVFCLAENVPQTANNAFEDSSIATATLHVPEGSVEKYQKSSVWGHFGSIVALAEPESVTYTKDQMATIILPTAPDASKGKYYKLDRCEDDLIVFAEELQPQARTPYIIVPHEDFSIDMSTLDVAGLSPDTVTVGGISFIGSYVRTILPALTGGDGGGSSSSYYDIIDTTPDCLIAQLGAEMSVVGALRAYLMVQWDDPIDHGGPKGPSMEKMGIIILDYGTSIDEIQNSKFETQNDGEIVNCKSSNSKCFDLSGRCVGNGQLKPGIYVVNGMKILVK